MSRLFSDLLSNRGDEVVDIGPQVVESLMHKSVVDMETGDANRKRSSDQVVGVPEQTVTGRELALVLKTSGGVVPLSPPPKQDPKRSKIVLQNEKSNIRGTNKTPTVRKNIDARSAASSVEDRRAQ